MNEIEQAVTALENISKEMTDSSNNDFVLTLISIIINVVLATAVIWQLLIYRSEINSRMRPWIGLTEKGIQADEHIPFGMEFNYVNYGSTPAITVGERWGNSTQLLIRNQVRKDFTHMNDLSCTLPTQIRKFSFVVDSTLIPNNVNSKLYIWVVIGYKYGKNKDGEYGVIIEYKKLENTNQARLFVKDEWII